MTHPWRYFRAHPNEQSVSKACRMQPARAAHFMSVCARARCNRSKARRARSSLDENTADVSVNRPLLTLLRLSESRRPSLIKPPLIIFQYAPARWSTEIGDWPRRAGEESDGGVRAREVKGRHGGLRRLKRQELRGRNPPEYATPLDRDTPSLPPPIPLECKDEFACSSWQLIVSSPIKGGY